MRKCLLNRMGCWFGSAALLLSGMACGGPSASAPAHACSGAGHWFPADPTVLRAEVGRHLDQAGDLQLPGRIVALVVPHAGYPYSGPTAGWAYRQVRGCAYARVVILAFSHTVAIDGASALDVPAYETPLGAVPVDRAAVEGLLKNRWFHSVPAAHATEHSDENQLPFLQAALGDFKLVSILVGSVDGTEAGLERLEGLAEAIRPLLDERTLLVVSSDMTHYGRPYEYVPFTEDAENNLRRLDGEAAAFLLRRDRDGFLDFAQRTGATICGRDPLALMLELLRGDPACQGVFLQYGRSGEPIQPDQMSVGYLALAYDQPGTATLTAPAPPEWVLPAGDRALLNADEQKTLLKLARDTIGARLQGDELDPLASGAYQITPRLMATQGAFVTLTEGGNLRGCIGRIVGRGPLYRTVAAMATEAAFDDARFEPLQAGELARLHVEISALLTPDGQVARDPCGPLTEAAQIRLGTDGLTLSAGGAFGVFLPQVPVEQGWDRAAFLRGLSEKAGLDPDAWRRAELRRFTAQVFGEPEGGNNAMETGRASP